MACVRLLMVAVCVCAAATAASGCGTVSGGTDRDAGGVAGTGGSVAGPGTGGGLGAGGGAGTSGTAGASAGAGSGGASGTGGGGGTGDTRRCTVEINEVQTGGATALDEFVELYNTCPDKPFNLAGHTLVYRAATGTAEFVRLAFTTEMIAAGQPYFVCANSGFAAAADAHYTDGLALDGGGLALRASDGSLVDAVGWGTAANALVEGAPAPAPAAGQSIARTPDGHDSDDNSRDFMIAAQPTPGAAN